jgi:protein-arginine kinase activator protein McsA
MRILSLGWVLKCYRDGRIRKNTIVNLIHQSQLEELMEYLIEQERYEQCSVVRDILNEVYNGENKKQIRSVNSINQNLEFGGMDSKF